VKISCKNCNEVVLGRDLNLHNRTCGKVAKVEIKPLSEPKPESHVSGGITLKSDPSTNVSGCWVVDENKKVIANAEFIKKGEKVFVIYCKHFLKYGPKFLKSYKDEFCLEIDFEKGIRAPDHVDMMALQIDPSVPSRFKSKIWDIDVALSRKTRPVSAILDIYRNGAWYYSPTQHVGREDKIKCTLDYATNTDRGDCGKAVHFEGVLLGFHTGSWEDGVWNVFLWFGAPGLKEYFKMI